MSDLKVRDLMTPDVFSLRTFHSVGDAVELMESKRVRHVPIVDGDGELVGLISHRDLLEKVLGSLADLPVSSRKGTLEKIKLEEVMTSVPETVEPDQNIVEAAELLLEYKFGCLPVTEGTHLVGILTEADFVRHVAGS